MSTLPTHLDATGEGWNTRTSTPCGLTSGARLAPNAEMKLLVAAYCTEKGLGMAAAADDVNTTQPRSFLAVWGPEAGAWVDVCG